MSETKEVVTAMDVANAMLVIGGDGAYITNLKLNKLVYYAYVEDLRAGRRLFDDDIEAWRHGPVIPHVYFSFKHYGYNRIPTSSVKEPVPDAAKRAAKSTLKKYGFMTATDIRDFSHRPTGAWVGVYDPRDPYAGNVIMDADILESSDGIDDPLACPTIAMSANSVKSRWSDALEMLKDS